MQRLLPLVLAATAAATALGVNAETFIDNARVRSVQPQYENVTVPRQECTSQWVTERHPVGGAMQQYGGAVIGGVAGGVLGNQVGKGHGREAATAVGAVVGAIAGNHIANGRAWGPRYEDVQREVQTCRTVNAVESRLTGYRVSYDWRGQTYTTFTQRDPGPVIPVRVSFEPMVQ